MHEHISHHVANVAAIVPVVLSFTLNAPAILTYVSTALAIVYYLILIGKEIYHWLKRK